MKRNLYYDEIGFHVQLTNYYLDGGMKDVWFLVITTKECMAACDYN